MRAVVLAFETQLPRLVEMMAERGLSLVHTRSCAGCTAMLRSSNAAGTRSPGRPEDHGGSTGPT